MILDSIHIYVFAFVKSIVICWYNQLIYSAYIYWTPIMCQAVLLELGIEQWKNKPIPYPHEIFFLVGGRA